VNSKEILPTSQAKLDEYPNLSVNWKEIYSLAFNVTLHTKLRVFQINWMLIVDVKGLNISHKVTPRNTVLLK